jgi:uncharacterized membrane protein HdeD (DUF308 family)
MKLKNIWWLLLLRGIVFLLFGIIAIGWPLMTFITLTYIFALYIIFSGIFNLIHGIMGTHHGHRYWFLTIIVGIFEIGVGAYAFNNPLINIAALTLLIGFTFIIRGVFETIAAFDDIYGNTHKTLLAIGGVLGIIAGIIILKYPIAGGLAFTWVLGVYALIVGSIFVALSMMARDITDEITKVFSINERKHTPRK